jgi:hypothetical protein
MIRSRRRIELIVAAVSILCTWFIFDMYFNEYHEKHVKASVAGKTSQHEATEAKEEHKTLKQGIMHAGMEHGTSLTSTAAQYTTSTLTQSTAVATPSSSLPDRVVVMAKVSTEDTHWVHTDLPDWQAAVYTIDTETPHNTSTLDPITNSTLRILRNKGREANAYLAYLVQNYNSLPSTIAFIHAHKDGYPTAWHTDNDYYSNVVSLQSLNIDFVQSNGYANLRCVGDPGCPHEVMPFRDPPEHHRTTEVVMPGVWRDLFNNTDVPHILATPCCAQFAVSSKQVQKRSLEEYKKYYTWLMETPLDDATSGRVFEYLWHILFGQDPV